MAAPLEGQRFSRLVVLDETEAEISGGQRCRRVIARCDCGGQVNVRVSSLRSGNTKSCGCYKLDGLRERTTVHGKSRTPLHNIWKSMRQRCLNKSDAAYPRYGGRGIKICEAWATFEGFEAWALDNGWHEVDAERKRDRLSLDRIDPDRGYEPDNCQWITLAANSRKKTHDERRRWVRWTLAQIEQGNDPIAELDRLEGATR